MSKNPNAVQSSLARTLAHLKKKPQPVLSAKIRSLQLTFAKRNAHYGARHFLKEDMPRVAYANPELPINVTRKEHKFEEPWSPEMVVLLADGTTKTVDMTKKRTSAIMDELLALSDLAEVSPSEAPIPSSIELPLGVSPS